MELRSYWNKKTRKGVSVYDIDQGFIIETWEKDVNGHWGMLGVQHNIKGDD